MHTFEHIPIASAKLESDRTEKTRRLPVLIGKSDNFLIQINLWCLNRHDVQEG